MQTVLDFRLATKFPLPINGNKICLHHHITISPIDHLNSPIMEAAGALVPGNTLIANNPQIITQITNKCPCAPAGLKQQTASVYKTNATCHRKLFLKLENYLNGTCPQRLTVWKVLATAVVHLRYGLEMSSNSGSFG